MADKAVSTASKPQMRGLLNAAIKRNIYVALAISAVSGIAFKELIGTARKRKYAEFYRYILWDFSFKQLLGVSFWLFPFNLLNHSSNLWGHHLDGYVLVTFISGG